MNHGTTPSPRGLSLPVRKITSVERKTLLSAGSVLAALGAVVCCVGSMLLLSLGVTGAWLGNFNALYPYRPYLIGIALALLAARYLWVYRKRRDCGEEAKACPTSFAARFDKAALWVSAALIAVAIGLPYAAPWLLSAS